MSTYVQQNVNFKTPQISALDYYADIRFDASDASPTYIGLNLTNGASTSNDTTWKLYKFTYSGVNVTRIQMAYGAWDNRVTVLP